jgi:hypothetical protein
MVTNKNFESRRAKFIVKKILILFTSFSVKKAIENAEFLQIYLLKEITNNPCLNNGQLFGGNCSCPQNFNGNHCEYRKLFKKLKEFNYF